MGEVTRVILGPDCLKPLTVDHLGLRAGNLCRRPGMARAVAAPSAVGRLQFARKRVGSLRDTNGGVTTPFSNLISSI
jgi:hypothetical protein